MPDPINRALRYRERAEECRRLAGIAAPAEIREHYGRIAEHYAALAEAEEKLAGITPQADGPLASRDIPVATLHTPPPRQSSG